MWTATVLSAMHVVTAIPINAKIAEGMGMNGLQLTKSYMTKTQLST